MIEIGLRSLPVGGAQIEERERACKGRDKGETGSGGEDPPELDQWSRFILLMELPS